MTSEAMKEWKRFLKAELERTERLTAETLERIARLREVTAAEAGNERLGSDLQRVIRSLGLREG